METKNKKKKMMMIGIKINIVKCINFKDINFLYKTDNTMNFFSII